MKLPHFPRKHIHDVTSGRSVFRRVARDAYIDWTGIFIISLLTALFLMGLGLNTFLNLDARMSEKQSSAKTNVSISIDTRILDSVLGDFDARAKTHDELISGYSGPGDPSI
jgi:hypothetical protein